MSNTPRNFDQPILLTSVAAREGLQLEPVPGESGRKYDHSSSSAHTPNASHNSEKMLHHEGHSASSDNIGGHASSQSPGAASDSNVRSVLASPVTLDTPLLDFRRKTEIRAGEIQKLFLVLTESLVAKSPYFAAMQNTNDNPNPPHRLAGPFFFPEVDEFAFALFVHWVHDGQLRGPHDFHSLHHYLGLYVLGFKFEIESLRNTVMDLVRSYYHRENMTAPAFRLDYIYANTDGRCPMRLFLVSTAAYRFLTETDQGLSDSIRGVLKRGGEVAPDLVDALVWLANNDREDSRKGDNCRWHEHAVTPKCKHWIGFEPFESP